MNHKQLAKMGGQAIAAKHAGDNFFSDIGKKGAAKRWRCQDINVERVCKKNKLKYLAGGKCPCFI